jgi:hypothetical protein
VAAKVKGEAVRVIAPEAWAGALKAGVAINTSRLKIRPSPVVASWRRKRSLPFMMIVAKKNEV